jgi:phage terminase large subunit-like protein
MAKAGETKDRCTQYALDVVSGKITAGEYVRLACQRHLDDIENRKQHHTNTISTLKSRRKSSISQRN